MHDSRTKRILLALLLVVGLVAAACGRDEEPSDGGGDDTSDTTGADGEEAAGPATTDACEGYDATAGITDDTIKIGTSLPQSGVAASVFGEIAKGYNLYIDQLNAEGGIGGRQIEIVARDDEYKPEETLANYEKLVSEDGVFALFNVIGTPNNLAIRDDQNLQCVPNLFLGTGSQLWGNPAEYPWTIGSIPTYPTEMAVLVDYLTETNPDATIAILYQNDDFGKGYYDSLKSLIEGTDITLAAEATYDPTSPDVTAQMNQLADSEADTLVLGTTGVFCASALGAKGEAGWDPLTYMSATCGASTIMSLAGDAAEGAMSAAYLKDPADPQWADDPGLGEFRDAGEAAGLSEEELGNGLLVYGWAMGQLLADTLENATALERVEVMNGAWHIDNLELPVLLPGIAVNTDAENDPYPIEQMRLGTYNGDFWELGDTLYDFEGETSQFSELD